MLKAKKSIIYLSTIILILSSSQSVASPGGTVGNELMINTETTGDQLSSRIALDADGDFIVTWQSFSFMQDGSNFGIYAQRYNLNNIPVGNEFLVNTFVTNIQSSPDIAMDVNGDFIITWQSDGQDGSGFGIFAQRYKADNTTINLEFPVSTYTNNDQRNPSIAMNANGDFVVTWESSSQDGSGYGIYAQRFDANGTATGNEFIVNTVTAIGQSNPDIAIDVNGNFVICWESQDQDGSGDGIYAQRFNANGISEGNEFLVNTYTMDNQRNPSIAMNATSDFVITWQSTDQDGSFDGIYAQRYNANGTKAGNEFIVNTTTVNFQSNPNISMNVDGNFVITWQGPDDTSAGVYAQRYNADGTTVGVEFLVNTYTTDDQDFPSVALDADGDFVITWQSFLQDGNGQGVFSQRYSGNFKKNSNNNNSSSPSVNSGSLSVFLLLLLVPLWIRRRYL